MKRIRALCAALPVVLGSSFAAGGLVLTVDPDAGTLSTDNGATWRSSLSWNGVTLKAGPLAADGAREYFVLGDFDVRSDDAVTAKLNTQPGVRFVVGNDARLAGAFNFSASGSTGRAGGGAGGSAGGGGAGGTALGAGGAGGRAIGSHGQGGAGGAGADWSPIYVHQRTRRPGWRWRADGR